jgi:hypothetical protein
VGSESDVLMMEMFAGSSMDHNLRRLVAGVVHHEGTRTIAIKGEGGVNGHDHERRSGNMAHAIVSSSSLKLSLSRC